MNEIANAVAVGAPLMTADEMPWLRSRDYCLKIGITRTKEFERRGLATDARYLPHELMVKADRERAGPGCKRQAGQACRGSDERKSDAHPTR